MTAISFYGRETLEIWSQVLAKAKDEVVKHKK